MLFAGGAQSDTHTLHEPHMYMCVYRVDTRYNTNVILNYNYIEIHRVHAVSLSCWSEMINLRGVSLGADLAADIECNM